jgi:hypothetical protein
LRVLHEFNVSIGEAAKSIESLTIGEGRREDKKWRRRRTLGGGESERRSWPPIFDLAYSAQARTQFQDIAVLA